MPCLGLSEASPWLHLVGRLHPLIVHFPIALLLAAGLAELLELRRPARGGEGSSVARFCLLLGALGATAAAGAGWVNAAVEGHGRSVAHLIEQHRWAGVSVAVLSWATLAAARSNAGGALYRGGLALTCALVAVTGHLGASLVWGEDYLFQPFRAVDVGGASEAGGHGAHSHETAEAPLASEPMPTTGSSTASEPANEAATPARIDFRAEIQPLLAEHCYRCHGAKRRKAGLRLDDPSELFAGEPEWWVIRPGSRAKSLLYQRISLPADHEDRMPGDGDPLPAEDIERIGVWIDQGAELGPGLRR